MLDLHSNCISKVEHLGCLTELRVLNLAGNHIHVLEDVGALQSLTELNARRNQIENVYELHFLPALQRVFLSNNRVQNFSAVSCLFKVKFLMELSLDGNPVALNDAAAYRRHLIDSIRTLRHLDLKRVTDQERRAAVMEHRREEERRRAVEKSEQVQVERKKVQAERNEAILAAERQWMELQQAQRGRAAGGDGSPGADGADGATGGARADGRPGSRGAAADGRGADGRDADGDAGGAADDSGYDASGAAAAADSRRERERTARRRARARGARAAAQGEGPAHDRRVLRGRDRARTARSACCRCTARRGVPRVAQDRRLGDRAVCRFARIERVIEKLGPHVPSFSRLRRLTLGDNALHSLKQVLALAPAIALSHVTELHITNNPVCELVLLRPVGVAACPQLRASTARPSPRSSARARPPDGRAARHRRRRRARRRARARRGGGGPRRQRLTDNDASTIALSRSTVDNAIAVAMRSDDAFASSTRSGRSSCAS